MKKLLIFIFIQFFCFNISYSKNIDVQQDLNLDLDCKFQKLILKNKEYNFQIFLPNEVDRKNLKLVKIKSTKPETLNIDGLSKFLLNNQNLEIKIVNEKIIYFRTVDVDKNYSESGILTRKTGELVHEITKNINSEAKEKDISFFNCEISKKNI
tara:strand:- start:122 stop:583 length:462 start_codon:yes stop_codon:yes gene_type:complete